MSNLSRAAWRAEVVKTPFRPREVFMNDYLRFVHLGNVLYLSVEKEYVKIFCREIAAIEASCLHPDNDAAYRRKMFRSASDASGNLDRQ
jgi:hypothetical protein